MSVYDKILSRCFSQLSTNRQQIQILFFFHPVKEYWITDCRLPVSLSSLCFTRSKHVLQWCPKIICHKRSAWWSAPCEGHGRTCALAQRLRFLSTFPFFWLHLALSRRRRGSSSSSMGVGAGDLTWIVNEWIKVWMWASIYTALLQPFLFSSHFCLLLI